MSAISKFDFPTSIDHALTRVIQVEQYGCITALSVGMGIALLPAIAQSLAITATGIVVGTTFMLFPMQIKDFFKSEDSLKERIANLVIGMAIACSGGFLINAYGATLLPQILTGFGLWSQLSTFAYYGLTTAVFSICGVQIIALLYALKAAILQIASRYYQ